ncbi:hypothetical protein RclHR1_12190002 [Rhizophagus clarus]|uniref:Jacalin-type lectin domain-containing protein n=1 Tax=Rhizophagus clarus TaxID=94130 RepID=A0A2Z6QYE7_9GLOM|nr:hypothetical protein RclHR1_12190002 [Rhizophagus clarus]
MCGSLGGFVVLLMAIQMAFNQWGPRTEVDLDQILSKTQNLFTNLPYDDFPIYQELIRNRIAVAKLASLLSSNNALDTYKKNIYDDLIRFDYFLNFLSRDLELAYEKENAFFMTFEKSVSEWEKLSKVNEYSSELFEVMRNMTNDLSSILFKIKWTVESIQQFVPSNKSDSVNYNERKELGPSQWINYLEIDLWCDISIIKECKYELFRVKNIVKYINEINLDGILFRVWYYSEDLDNIIKDLKKDNVIIKQNAIISSKLKSLVNKIKFSYNLFLKGQDVFSKFNDYSLDITEDIKTKILKSELIGQNGCRAEFMTYFTIPPVFQGARKTKQSPSLKQITISANIYIDSLTFKWSDNISTKYGGNGGYSNDLKLEEGEAWKSTNVLGRSSSFDLVLEAPRGYEMVGFYGSYDEHLCGIGILYSKIVI